MAKHTYRVPLRSGFIAPMTDLHAVTGTIGSILFGRDCSLSQHVWWSIHTGLIGFMGSRDQSTIDEIISATALTECGADSLLGVLLAIGLVVRPSGQHFSLTALARDYLLEDSPYFVGHQLDRSGLRMPRFFTRHATFLTQLYGHLPRIRPLRRYGGTVRMENQHARNLFAGVHAVRTGMFSDVTSVVDIAGGSGTFAIPFSLEYPDKHIVIADLPSAKKNAETMLRMHGLFGRVQWLSFDAFKYPWCVPQSEGFYIGNFLHGFSDEVFGQVCNESFLRLRPDGRIWIHEMVWNEQKTGPLTVALWHARMRAMGPGRQRSASEISTLLLRQGFRHISVKHTAGSFALICGRKPR